jgi:hypothetical protein
VRRQNQQVAAGAIVEDGRWLGALHDELRARLAPVFAQARPRLAAFAYLGALLTDASRLAFVSVARSTWLVRA